jgi:hypothetical protein
MTRKPALGPRKVERQEWARTDLRVLRKQSFMNGRYWEAPMSAKAEKPTFILAARTANYKE